MTKVSGQVHDLSEWFLDNNVCLYGEKALAAGTVSRVKRAPADLVTGEPLVFRELVRLAKDDNTSINSVQEPNNRSEEGAQRKKESTATPAGTVISTFTKTYYIIDEQYEEAERTARGLLLMPEVKGSLVHDSESIKEHLFLQYAGKDGDLLLDHVVEDLARDLACDLLVLDAHDIANLITRPGLKPRITKDGRMLSYDVYNAAFSDSPKKGQAEESKHEEDDEEDVLDGLFDESSNDAPRRGMPILIGKSIPMDIKSMFEFPRRSSDISRSRPMGDMFSYRTEGDFKTVVQNLLNSLADRQNLTKRKSQGRTETTMELERLREYAAKQTGIPKGATIMHVKDLESIQETGIGLAFLQELYQGISKRRKSGESLLLIGTDSVREGEEPFTKERIEELQKGYRDEISQNLVITPVLPITTSKLALLHDRRQRIATINMRHLKKHEGEDSYQYPERRTLAKRHFDKALEDISASKSEDMSSLRDIKKFDD